MTTEDNLAVLLSDDSLAPKGKKHNYEVHNKCEHLRCHICDGGLLHCLDCNGAESSLTTDCVGRRLTDNEQTCVANGDDFKNNKWIRAL